MKNKVISKTSNTKYESILFAVYILKNIKVNGFSISSYFNNPLELIVKKAYKNFKENEKTI